MRPAYPAANDNRGRFLWKEPAPAYFMKGIGRESLFEFDGLVQCFLKLLLSVAVGGQSPFFMAASESFMACAASASAFFRSALIVPDESPLLPPVLPSVSDGVSCLPSVLVLPSAESSFLASCLSSVVSPTFSASPADAPESPAEHLVESLVQRVGEADLSPNATSTFFSSGKLVEPDDLTYTGCT